MRIEINKAIALLKEGEIVALPTETVYGLAVAMNNQASIDRLFQLKGRSKDKPMAIAVGKPTDIFPWIKNQPVVLEKLMKHFWPGPLTIVLEAAEQVPQCLVSQRGGVGLRYSSSLLLEQIISAIGFPLVLSSANLSGQADALTAAQVAEYFPEIGIVAADAETQGRPSTVIELIDNSYRLLREGAIPLAEIQALLAPELVLPG